MLEDQLRKWIERYEENGYLHGTLLIASNEEILLNKGFGMANWEHKVPNQPASKFRIGSLTKAFTALAIFQLQERSLLNIDDSIGIYLPNYPQGENITIYHCLTHSSGIPNYTSFPDFWTTTMRLPSTLYQLIDSFKDHPLNFKPGSRFDYSNSGNVVLTAIIEKVSDRAYGDYIREEICDPLGMENTGCDDGITVIPNLASGYSYWEEPIHSAYADLSFPLGAYGLYATTEDLFLWDKALKSNRLLNKDQTKKMFAAHHGSYACGWMVSDKLGRKCVHHFGDISGFSSNFLRFVDEEVTIIFLSNMAVTPVTLLTEEIAKIFFKEKVSLPPTAKATRFKDNEVIVGKYFIEGENETFEISIKQNDLYLTVPKRYGVLYKFKLVPISHHPTHTTFLTEMVHEQLTFHYSTSGKIEHVEYKDFNDMNFRACKVY